MDADDPGLPGVSLLQEMCTGSFRNPLYRLSIPTENAATVIFSFSENIYLNKKCPFSVNVFYCYWML